MGWAFISNNNNRRPMVFSAAPALGCIHVESLSHFFFVILEDFYNHFISKQF